MKPWSLIKLGLLIPKDKKLIGCKWVYRVKLKADGSIDRFKARLGAKGFNQIEGNDFHDNFSPAAKVVTVRILFVVAVINSWLLYKLDVNSAFLHDFLDEEIYMQPLKGYDNCKESQVCKLKKSFYGLKQVARQWNTKFSKQLLKYCFRPSCHDHCLFILSKSNCFLVL